VSETPPPPAQVRTPPTTNWSIGGLFLEALAQRDFAQLGDCFEPEATMRALLPYGPDQFQGAPQIVSAFRLWFGSAEDFEVVDGSVGDVGDRLHLSWRLRVRPTPMGDDDWHVIEQQAYLRAGERIDTLDLLCSGFMPAGQH
jgi:hypothetical protein